MIFRDYVRLGDQQFHKGNLRKAAEFYVKGERYEQAARLFEKLNLVDEAVESYEKARKFFDAGDLLEREGRFRDAIRLFERAGNHRRAAEASLQAEGSRSQRRRLSSSRPRMFDRAAKCYAEEHQQYAKALQRVGA